MLHDVDLQCANLLKLAEGGEVGIILYYVGICLPHVDQRLIDIADENDFVLISMPENRRDMRYGEVLCDVWECIFRDRLQNEALVPEILDRVSRLPVHQRCVETVLKMLSDRISASIILMDSSLRIINLISWPRSIELHLKGQLESLSLLPIKDTPISCPFIPNSQMYRCTLHPDHGAKMELLIIKEGFPLTIELCRQAIDVVSLSVNIWGEQHGDVAVHELVRAILKDEPIKMRRLAQIFHIDVASIHEMWILRGERETSGILLAEKIPELREMLLEISSLVIADLQEDKLLLFLAAPSSLKDTRQLISHLLQSVIAKDDTITLIRCNDLKNTGEVRSAYLCHEEALSDVRKIYPDKRHYSLNELQFARECRRLIEQGEEALEDCLSPLYNLQTDNEGLDLTTTLKVYLLDGNSSVTVTSQLLYLHKNTIKYRLSRITELFGFRPDKFPESIRIYRAAAVHRLLH